MSKGQGPKDWDIMGEEGRVSYCATLSPEFLAKHPEHPCNALGNSLLSNSQLTSTANSSAPIEIISDEKREDEFLDTLTTNKWAIKTEVNPTHLMLRMSLVANPASMKYITNQDKELCLVSVQENLRGLVFHNVIYPEVKEKAKERIKTFFEDMHMRAISSDKQHQQIMYAGLLNRTGLNYADNNNYPEELVIDGIGEFRRLLMKNNHLELKMKGDKDYIDGKALADLNNDNLLIQENIDTLLNKLKTRNSTLSSLASLLA